MPVSDMQPLVRIIHEDSGILVVNKPAGLVCHPTKGDVYSSLISRVRLYLSDSIDLHLVNRLDRETSGLVVVAKNIESAVKLRKIWEQRAVRKEYVAIVHGHPAEDYGIIDAALGKDERSRVAIKDCARPDGSPASTEYWVKQRFLREQKPFSLLRVVPRTGRKHQIRIHLAYHGCPIVGDKLYGADEDLYLALVENRLTMEQRQQLILPHHALHAGELQFCWDSCECIFQAEPEPWFVKFLAEEDRR
jgi:23S rRNA pseudouridine1911/1915/1917 synthase